MVELGGVIDLETSPRGREVLLRCLHRGHGLLVDLSAVERIDTSGLASLLEAHQAARQLGLHFGLIAPSRMVARVLRLARLDSVFTVLARAPETFQVGALPAASWSM